AVLSPPLPPTVSGVSVGVNPLNALSTVLTLSARNADSARVIYWANGEDSLATPYQGLQNGSARIVTLGLSPRITYTHVVEVVRGRGTARSRPLSFATGDLPPPLQEVPFDVTGVRQHGYTLTAVSLDSVAFVVAFSARGRVRWYRSFPMTSGESVGETKQQPNGDFTVF